MVIKKVLCVPVAGCLGVNLGIECQDSLWILDTVQVEVSHLPVISLCRFEEIAFSFNGGKDSTVISYILFSSSFLCVPK